MIDVKQIENPTKEYRAKPFWSLNGKLKKEELKKQILNMKKWALVVLFCIQGQG